MTPTKFYAIQAITKQGKKYLCWKEKKHFYFGESSRGYDKVPPPTLFSKMSEARKALKNVPSKGANLKQFEHIIECEKTNVVTVRITT